MEYLVCEGAIDPIDLTCSGNWVVQAAPLHSLDAADYNELYVWTLTIFAIAVGYRYMRKALGR